MSKGGGCLRVLWLSPSAVAAYLVNQKLLALRYSFRTLRLVTSFSLTAPRFITPS